MTDLEEFEARLLELNKIKPFKPAAAQLRSRRHALVNRIQRREDKRYWESVQKTKLDIQSKILDLKSKQLLMVQPQTPLISQTPLMSPTRVLTRVESKKRLGVVR